MSGRHSISALSSALPTFHLSLMIPYHDGWHVSQSCSIEIALRVFLGAFRERAVAPCALRDGVADNVTWRLSLERKELGKLVSAEIICCSQGQPGCRTVM